MNDPRLQIDLDSFEGDEFDRVNSGFHIREGLPLRIIDRDNNNKEVLVYTPQLAFILIAKELYVTNLESKLIELYKCEGYRRSYIDGFIEGENEFQEKWSIKPDTLYGNGSKIYAQDIIDQYSLTDPQKIAVDWTSGGTGMGWKQQAESIPLVITHAIMKKYGFYAGLVCKAEELMRTRKSLFVQPEEIKCQNSKPKKEFDSIVRVRAFYLGLLQQSGKMDFFNGEELKKTEIIEFVRNTWSDPNGKPVSGKTVYEEALLVMTSKNPITKSHKEKYPKDYEYSLKLYKEAYPD